MEQRRKLQESKAIDAEFDLYLRKEQDRSKRKSRILVLGLSGSGKTAFVRQLKSMFTTNEYADEENVVRKWMEGVQKLGEEFLPSDIFKIVSTYLPTEDLSAIIDFELEYQNQIYQIIHVNRQLSERKKWLHCFEDITAVCYIVDISSYDEKIKYDDGEESFVMDESLNLFEALIRSKWFDRTNFILLLNKIDLLQDKLNKTSPIVCFPDYKAPDGGDEYYFARDFIGKKFRDKFHPHRTLHAHWTNMLDEKLMSSVWELMHDVMAKDIIVE